jgi:hypothetical protein
MSPLDKEAWLRVAEEWLKLALSVEAVARNIPLGPLDSFNCHRAGAPSLTPLPRFVAAFPNSTGSSRSRPQC